MSIFMKILWVLKTSPDGSPLARGDTVILTTTDSNDRNITV
jgi:hypothetical protein